MIDHLVDRRINESHELNFGDRSHTLHGHTDRDSGDHAFGQRCVLYAIFAEPGLQTGGRPKYAAVDADVFAEDYDAGIVL